MKCALFAGAVAVVLFAAGGAPAADAPAKQRDDSAAEKLGFRLGLQCYTFRAISFFETVDKAAAMGIRYLEIYPGQKLKPGSPLTTSANMSDDVIAEIKQKLKDAGGLKIVCYGVAGVPNDEAGARKLFDWAKKMGIEVLVTETTPTPMHDKLCQEYGIRIALHNHPATWPPDKVLAACKGLTPMIGSCSDTGHWMRANMNPVENLRKLEGRIISLHFKDLNKFGADKDPPGGAHDVPWGTGKGDVRAMLAELKRQGFKGYFSIEYEHGGVDDLLKNVPKCVEYFDKVCAELAG